MVYLQSTSSAMDLDNLDRSSVGGFVHLDTA